MQFLYTILLLPIWSIWVLFKALKGTPKIRGSDYNEL